jgi:hypothetical protein
MAGERRAFMVLPAASGAALQLLQRDRPSHRVWCGVRALAAALWRMAGLPEALSQDPARCSSMPLAMRCWLLGTLKINPAAA